MADLIKKLAQEFNAEIEKGGCARFSVNDDNYIYCSDGSRLYVEIEGRLAPGGSVVKTIKAVNKFIALRA